MEILSVLTLDQYAFLLERLNANCGKDIKNITLLAGMDFLDRQKWWLSGEWRDRSHEGVDLVCWTDDEGKRHFLGDGLKVPCLISGDIVAICDDFLGKSVFVRGKDRSNRDIVAVHAHIVSRGRVGDRLVTGEAIGTIAPATGVVPAHLHLSLLRYSPDMPWEDMNWQYLNACDLHNFLKPFV